ncbi:probable 37S ribosomal protein S28, mitochondrial [Brassica napus]|uniref:probable 37S ribosomal protein S28, mitochondrial n=1 Tax=Brassica napus TaxID=3708 RepID=UPI0020788132|nr:probable 37S ribosomal protein S28, mitochondrial [Brassica napus]
MAFHLARRKQRLHSNPSLIHLFSTSSSSSSSASSPQDGNESGEQPSQPSSDFKISSYFSGIKSSLKQQPQHQAQDGRRQLAGFDAKAPSFSGSGGDFQDIRRNLNEFRRRAAAPPARDLQDLYKQNVLSKSGDLGAGKVEGSPFENLKKNLRQMRPQETRWSNLSSLQSIMKTKDSNNVRSNVFGGGEGLPISVFGEEIEERKKMGDDSEEMKSEFIKSYDTKELGEILRQYRPEGKREEGWFSLQELNQRLVKLREVEEAAAQGTRKGIAFDDLRSEIQQARKSQAFQNLDFFSVLNGTPKYLLEPPKDELVQTYFHPDNMSSAEKMKIELAKVREEFKMSESDCGSARVQVAQLTTKIKHLSSVLHKKDKHSKKGLIAMVHRRKKLLKYMRRTDWDSYCLSLSKLGLRDNPDYKF